MSTTSITQAAALLVAIRRAQQPPVAALPDVLAPRHEDDAYAIQHAVLQQLGVQAGGWKATMPDAHSMLSAPIIAGMVLPSPARLTPAITATQGTQRWGIEPEIAFRLQRALPARTGQPYAREEVLAAVAAAHAAIEICVSRFIDHEAVPPLDRLADAIINEALVLGLPQSDWRALDLPQLSLRVLIDGEPVHEGHGGHPIGDPVIPLVAIANHLAARGMGLRAGDVVTTGSFNGIRYAGVGQHVQVEFAGFGAASIAFANQPAAGGAIFQRR